MKLTYRKMLVALLGLTSFALANVADAKEGLFRMQKQGGGQLIGKVIITALDNDIRITDIQVNRGNCKVSESFWEKFDSQTKEWKQIDEVIMNYGQVKTIYTDCPSNLLEVVITTNKGTETHTW